MLLSNRLIRCAGPATVLGLLALSSPPSLAQRRPTGLDSTYTTTPVGKVNFVAWLYYGSSQLELTTWRDTNSAAFEIQQSTNRRRWQVLASMDAHPQRIDSTTYVYLDINPQRYGGAVLYYRMRQIAQNGQFTYSPIYTIWLDKPTSAN